LARSGGVTGAAATAQPATDAGDGAATLRVHTPVASTAGVARLSLRLDPVELGSLDISVHTRADGSQAVHIAVERTDTLGLLQRDQGQLHAALERAGIQSQGPKLELQLTLAEQRPAAAATGGNDAAQQHSPDAQPGRQEGRGDPSAATTGKAEAGPARETAGLAAPAPALRLANQALNILA
jgi:flagellar hook-length control protein FliK